MQDTLGKVASLFKSERNTRLVISDTHANRRRMQFSAQGSEFLSASIPVRSGDLVTARTHSVHMSKSPMTNDSTSDSAWT